MESHLVQQRAPFTLHCNFGPCIHPPDVTPPIKRVPPDILGLIFKLYLDSGDRVSFTTSSLSVSSESNLTPFILGHVCQHWRHLVLVMPFLWSSIFIHIPKCFYIPSIMVWLDRAKDSPLDIHIEVSSRRRPDEHLTTKQILYMLSRRSYLWRRLRLVIFSEEVTSLLTNLPDLDLPILEDLSLDLIGSIHLDQGMGQVWHKLHRAHQLRRLCWHSVEDKLPSNLPYGQLTYLKIKLRVQANVLFDILQSCENLDELDVDVISTLGPSTVLKPLILEKLRRLTITFRTSCRPIYDNLNLPSLTSINICHEWGVERPLNFRSFQEFMLRSSCQLQEIKIWDFKANFDELIPYLDSSFMASIVKLELASKVNESVVRSLTSFNDQGPLLPQLQDLEILFNCSREALMTMVASRLVNESCATLRSLRVNFQIFKLHPTSVRYYLMSSV